MPGRISSSLLEQLVGVNCPACQFGFEVEVADAACQVWRWCPCCRSRIRLMEPGGEVHGAMEEVESAMREFQKNLGRMFR